MRVALMICLIASLLLEAVCASSLPETEGHHLERRPGLGHFKDTFDLYRTYASHLVNQNLPADDFRSKQPSADQCIQFFQRFRVRDYTVDDPAEFVLLDACLGYLFEASTYHEKDKQFSVRVSNYLDDFVADDRLKRLYEGTKFEELEEPVKDCIGGLLMHSIFNQDTCSNGHIQGIVRFATSQLSIPKELRGEDSYLREIYGLVKRQINVCFAKELLALDRTLRDHPIMDPIEAASKSLAAKLGTQADGPIAKLVVCAANLGQSNSESTDDQTPLEWPSC